MEAKQYATKKPRNHWRNQKGNQKYLETNDNENTTTQTYGMQKDKFIAIQSYLKKQETSQINNLTLHPKQLEKEEQKDPQS